MVSIALTVAWGENHHSNMNRPELRHTAGEFAHEETEKKPIRDREWWWKWLVDYPRELERADYDNQLLVMGDPQEFSIELSNEGMARMLSHMEVGRYNVQIKDKSLQNNISYPLLKIESSFNDWPIFVQDDVLSRLNKQLYFKPLANKIKEENWNFSQISSNFISIIAQQTYGFESRYWMPRLESKEEIIERSIAIGAYMLKQVIDERHWGNSIDALIITSAVLPEDLSIQIVEFARSLGFLAKRPKIELRDVRLACSSSNVGMLLAAEDPKIKNKDRVVMITLEPLGDMLGLYDKFWSYDQPQLPLSGNGFLAKAIKASEVSAARGSKMPFLPDETRLITYYNSHNLEPSKKLAEDWKSWISDESGLVKWFSEKKGHIAVLLDVPAPLQEGIPAESGAITNYKKWARQTFADVILDIELHSEESGDLLDLTERPIIISNQSSERMMKIIKETIDEGLEYIRERRVAKSMKSDEEQDVDFLSQAEWRRQRVKSSREGDVETYFNAKKANNSSASVFGALLTERAQEIWRKNKGTIIIGTTGVGASLGYFLFRFHQHE